MRYAFLVPSYKTKFLKESLESMLSQTFGDFCVLVSDDNSPEDLYPIVQPFLKDKRVSYRKNGRNIGAENLVSHWNLLLSLTDAQYVIMASDDDIFHPSFLENIDKLTARYPEAHIFRPRIRTINESGDTIREEPQFKETLDVKDFLSLWSCGELCSGIPFYVFDRKYLLEHEGFTNYPYATYSDDATVLKAVGTGTMPVSSDILFSFRMSGISISSKADYQVTKRKIQAAEKFYRFLKQEYKLSTNEMPDRMAWVSKSLILENSKTNALRLSLLTIFGAMQHIGTKMKFSILKQSAKKLLWKK